MKNASKFLSAAIVAVIVLFTAINTSIMFSFQQPQQSQFKAPQQRRQQESAFKAPQQTQPKPQGATFSFQIPQQTQSQPTTSFSTPQQPQPISFVTNTPQQPQETLNWDTMEFKQLTQQLKKTTETVKTLSDKVIALEDTIKTMQSAMDTLRATESQNHSTSMKLLYEVLNK